MVGTQSALAIAFVIIYCGEHRGKACPPAAYVLQGMTNNSKMKTECGSEGKSSRRKHLTEPGRKCGKLAGGGG